MDQQKQNWSRLVSTLIALLLILMPFIFDPRLVNPKSFDRFVIPRDTVFLLGCVVLVTVWVIRSLWRHDWQDLSFCIKTWLHRPLLFVLWEGCLGLFLILACLSLAFTTLLPFSVVALQALWLGCLCYFVVSHSVSFPHLLFLLRVQVLLAGVVGLHCLLQHYSSDPLTWFITGINVAEKSSGYIGNAGHAGAYLAVAVPLGLALVGASSALTLRVALIGAVGLACAGLFITGSRGGFVALIFGLSVLTVLSRPVFFRPTIFSGWRSLSIGAGALVMVAWLAFPWIQATHTWDKAQISWQRIVQGEWDRVSGMRFYHWQVTWRMVQEHPLTGTGIGTFAHNIGQYKIRFNALRDPAGGMPHRAHNEFLQVWAEMGTPAFLVALMGTLALLGWGRQVSRQQNTPRPERWVAIGLTAGLATSLPSALVNFVFHVSVTALPVILCAAGLGIFGHQAQVQAETLTHRERSLLPIVHRPWLRLTFSLGVTILALLLVHQILRPLRGLYAENQGDWLLTIADTYSVSADTRPLLFATAEQRYHQALNIYPHSLPAYIALGYAQLRQQKYAESSASLKRALHYVEAGEVYSLLGTNYFEAGKLRAAEEAFQTSLKVKYTGRTHQWLNKVGTGYLEAGELRAAEQVFQTSLQIGYDGRAHNGLDQVGMAYFKAGELQTAEQVFQTSLQIKSTERAQRWLEEVRAVISFEAGDLRAAEAAFQTSLQIQYNGRAHKGLDQVGTGYLEAGDLRAAERVFQTSLKVKYTERTHNGLDQVGMAYFKAGELQTAEQVFQTSLQIKSTERAQRWLEEVRAVISFEAGDLRAAEQGFQTSLQIQYNGRAHNGLDQVGTGYLEAGDLRAAERVFQTSLKVKYTERAHNGLDQVGMAYFKAGELGAAEQVFQTSLQLKSTKRAQRWLEKVRASISQSLP